MADPQTDALNQFLQQKYIEQQGAGQTTQPAQPSQPAQQNYPGIYDWLPTIGGVVGGAAGVLGGAMIPGADLSGVPEVAGGIAGAGMGQAGGRALQNFLTGQKGDLGDIATQGAWGAGGQAAGLGIGGVLGKLLGKGGAELATQGLNPTAGQAASFAKNNMGASISDVLTKNKLVGGGLDEIQSKLGQLHDAFSDAVNNSGLTVDKQTIDQHVGNAVQKLTQAPTLQNQGLLKSLADEYNNLFKSIGSKDTYDATDINKWRQQFDKQTSTFNPQDPFGGDVQRTMGTVLRRSIQDSADKFGLNPVGQSLKDLGTNISQLKDLEAIAQKNQFKPATGSLFSNLLPKILAGVGATALGQNPFVGVGAEMGGEAILKNPLIAKMLSQGATAAGQGISSGAGAGIFGAAGVGGANALQQLLGGGMGNTPPGQDQNTQSTPSNGAQNNGQNQVTNGIQDKDIIYPTLAGIKSNPQGQHSLPDIQAQTPIPVKQSITPGDYAKQNQQLSDLNKQYGTNPVFSEQIKSQQMLLDDRWNKQQELNNQYLSQHQLNGDQKDFVQNFKSYNDIADRVRQELVTAPPNILLANKTISDLKQYQNGNYAQLASDLKLFYDLSGRQIQGGVLRGFDVSAGINPAPNIGMSQNEALRKLNTLHETAINRYKDLYPAYTMSNYVDQGAGQ